MALIEDRNYINKPVTMTLKYFEIKRTFSTNDICDFCNKRIEFTGEKHHYQLCNDCRRMLNKKITNSLSVMDQSQSPILNQNNEGRGF